MPEGVAEAFVTVRPDVNRFGGELRRKMGPLAKVAAGAMVGVGAAITAALVDGVRQFASFEQSMNEVFTLLPDLSERAMGQMQDDVRALSKEIGITTDETVPALYQAISAGVPQENVFEFLEVAGKAAIGGVTDIETAVDGMSSVVNAFGEENVNAAEAADLMFTAVRLGKTDFEQLSDRLFQVNPLAAALGVNFEDITAAMATMTSQGTPTRVAATQLRGMFQELSKEGSTAAGVFEDMAGKTFQEFIAEGNNTADALDVLREASEKTGTPLQDMFGTVEGGLAALQLAQEGGEGFREALGEMADAAGATEEAFRQMDQGSARAWERLGVAVNDLRIGIGEELAPTVERVSEWLVDNMPAIEEAVGNAMASIADWIDNTARPAWNTFVEAMQDNWPAIQELGEALTEMFAALGDLISAVMGDAATDVSDSTDSQSEDFDGLAGDIQDVIEILTTLARTVGRVAGEMSDRWNLLAGGLTGDSERMKDAFISLDERWGGIGSSMLRGFMRLAIGVKTQVDRIVTWFRELPGRIMDALSGLGASLGTAGSRAVGNFISGMSSRLPDVAGVASRLASRVRGFFPSSPAKEGPFSGKGDPKLLGQNLAKQFAEGFSGGQGWGEIDRMLGSITTDVPTSLAASANSAGHGTPVSVPVMIRDVDGLARELGRSEAFIDSYGRVSAKRSRLTAGA